MELTQDEVKNLAQDQNIKQEVLQSTQQQGQEQEVESDIALRMRILELESKEETASLMSRDIMLANLSDGDKETVGRFIDIALRFKDLELFNSSKHFYKKALLIAGVSRGVKGFQQDKLNERRQINESNFEGLRPAGSWNPFRRNK